MRKRFSMLLTAATLVLGLYSCSSSDDDMGGKDSAPAYVKAYKASEILVYVGNDTIANSLTRAVPAGLTDKAYYYLRIDNRIPSLEGALYNSTLYYPRTGGNGSLKSSVNEGKVTFEYPYYAGLGSVPHYVYDPLGVETEKALAGTVPTAEQLLNGDLGNPRVSLPVNMDTLKVIWYVVKYQTVDRLWHVDGVLTGKSTPSIDSIPDFKKEDGLDPVSQGIVEVNLAIQEHKDEKSSKLSIHVRDTTDVTVNIPISPDYFLDKDDTDIAMKHYDNMVYAKEMQIGNTTVKVTVEYSDAGITVKTEGINSEVLKICRQLYEDGLTFEIWNYYNENTTDEILKAALDRSTVSFTRAPKIYFNAIRNTLDMNVKPTEGYPNVEAVEDKGNKYTK